MGDFCANISALPLNSTDGLSHSAQVLSWATVPLLFFGLLSNLAIIVVRKKPELRSSINLFLLGLAVTDGGTLFFIALYYVPVGISSFYDEAEEVRDLHIYLAFSQKIFYPLVQMFNTAAIYIRIAVAVERYFAVCQPLMVRSVCTLKKAARAILLIVLFSILYNFSRYFEFDIGENKEGEPASCPGPAQRLFNGQYMSVYDGWCHLVFMFALPNMTIFCFNVIIIWTLRKWVEKRKRMTMQTEGSDYSTTIMLLSLTFLFLLSNTVRFGIRVADHNLLNQLFGDGKETGKLSSSLIRLMLCVTTFLVCLNASTNFIIYFIFSRQFRKSFREAVWGPMDRDSAMNSVMRTDGNFTTFVELRKMEKSESCPQKLSLMPRESDSDDIVVLNGNKLL